jgi:hypothetical protein
VRQKKKKEKFGHLQHVSNPDVGFPHIAWSFPLNTIKLVRMERGVKMDSCLAHAKANANKVNCSLHSTRAIETIFTIS